MSFLRWTFSALLLVALAVAVVAFLTGVAYFAGGLIGGWFGYPTQTAAVFATYTLVRSAPGAMTALVEALADLPPVDP